MENNNYGVEGKILINVFSTVMEISEENIYKMIEKNKLAKEFVSLGDVLSYTSDIENIKALISLTLHREFDDLSPLNMNDIKYIKGRYDIDLGKKIQRNNLNKGRAIDFLKSDYYRRKPFSNRVDRILNRYRMYRPMLSARTLDSGYSMNLICTDENLTEIVITQKGSAKKTRKITDLYLLELFEKVRGIRPEKRVSSLIDRLNHKQELREIEENLRAAQSKKNDGVRHARG